MKILHLCFISPLCASVALAAPDVQPLPSAFEHKTLPSALKQLDPAPSNPRIGEALPIDIRATEEPAKVLHTDTPIPIAPDQSETVSATIQENKPLQQLHVTRKKTRPHSAGALPAKPNEQTSEQEALSNEAIKLYESKDYKGAMALLKQLQPFYLDTKDAGMLSLIGFTALETQEPKLALQSFRQAAEWTDDEEYWLFLVDAYLRLNQAEEAEKILAGLPDSKARDQRMDGLLGARASKAFESGQYALAEKMLLESKTPLGAGNLELLGWIQLRLGKLAEAATRFEAAYRKNPTSGAAQGLAFSHQRLKSIDKLIALADELQGPLIELTNDPAVREQVAAGQFSRIAVNEKGVLTVGKGGSNASSSQGVTVSAAPIYRQRKGEAGQGRLQVSGATADIDWVGERDSVNLKVDQFVADNGVVRQNSMNTLYALWRHQTEDAMELSLGLGLSPSGGVLSAKPLGEFGMAKYDTGYGWNAKLFRQANMESILSMSGAQQMDAHGNILRWGQALEDGITLGGYTMLPGWLNDWKAEGSLTAARISGTHIADNSKLAFWGRALRPLDGWDGWRVGADIYASTFSKNQSYYTPGFGGYYSPQASLSIGPALAFEQQIGPVKVNANAGVGWGYVKQAAADGNPLTGENPGLYPSSSSSGLATHLDVDMQWAFVRNWAVGLKLSGQTSPGYEEWRGGLFLSRKFPAPDAP